MIYQADYYMRDSMNHLKLMHLSLFANSKTHAINLAKQEAKKRGWRFLEVILTTGESENGLPCSPDKSIKK